MVGLAVVMSLLASACGRSDEPDVKATSYPRAALIVDVAGLVGDDDNNNDNDEDGPPVLVVVKDGEDSAPLDAVSESAASATVSQPATPEAAAAAAASGNTSASPSPAPSPFPSPPPAPAPAPRPAANSGVPLVIFDTDMGPDIDDALGLAMLHAYQKQGLIELAAVTISRNSEAAAKYTDALNTYYGRPDIPIGIYRSSSAPYFNDRGNYIRLADNWTYDLSSQSIEDGYKLQRRVMADALADGRTVLLIQTGFSGNVSQLLNSGGDSISSKSGIELARQSVKELSIMAGAFDMSVVEFNIENDIPPARNVFAKWPGPMAVSPFELGYNIMYPYSAIKSELSWDGNHPIRKSYELYDLQWHQDAPPYYNMRSWDLTSIIHAIEPQNNYFLTSQQGTVTVAGDGRTTFKTGSGQHYVLDRGRQYSAQQRQRVVDRMVELVSMQP